MSNTDETLEHFSAHGWMRVRAAFSPGEAEAMRAAIWCALGSVGIRQYDPSTWTRERPEHLQQAKRDPAFRQVGSARVIAAIDAVLEGRAYEMPKNWGAPFIAFPSNQVWNVPSNGWHIEANYVSALAPPDGVRTHALFGDVAPRSGGTLILSGSHRLVHAYFKNHPPPRGARGAEYRRLLQRHPYLRDLHIDGGPVERTERFMNRVEVHDGIPLQVIEIAGSVGDVMLIHPLLLHVAAPNNGTEPRFLLSGGIDLPTMWPQLESRNR